ncbi:MAG: electron transport complex protein RnfA [Lachnospiraceae bacterium]|nr:electron transport complex protein RnfA [Lachnospiraceae bacterium]MBR1815864.1 electron transport complex protein RnfA [Lachnospiraceae bacterium]
MNIILLAISAAFVNNVILVQFLGICPFLGVSKQIKTAAGMGGAVIFVMAISSTVTSLIYYYVLEPLDIAYLNTIVFILVIAALVQFVEMFLKKSVPSLYRALGVYLPLITTNCAVLGIAISNVDSGYNILESIINGVFSAVGFAVALILMAGIREKLDKNDSIPESFKGTPIVLISAGLMAIAFAGLAGLI